MANKFLWDWYVKGVYLRLFYGQYERFNFQWVRIMTKRWAVLQIKPFKLALYWCRKRKRSNGMRILNIIYKNRGYIVKVEKPWLKNSKKHSYSPTTASLKRLKKHCGTGNLYHIKLSPRVLKLRFIC